MATRTKSAIEQLREQYPDVWMPEAGDTLTGVVWDLDRAWSDARAKGNAGDGWYPLIYVMQADGVVLKWHAFTTVSHRQVLDHQPAPGEAVKITYLGEGRAKQGMNAPRIYKLIMPDRDPKERAARIYDALGAKAYNPAAVTPPINANAADAVALDRAQAELEAQFGDTIPE